MSDNPRTPTQHTTANPYIRTYAKDAASLGGGGASRVPTPAPPPVPLQAQIPQTPLSADSPVASNITESPKPEPPLEPSEPIIGSDLPPANIVPKAPTTSETREEVLTRLRAKFSQTPTVSASVTLTKPPPGSSSREEVLARLKKNTAPTTESASLSPIHTYSSDFRDISKQKSASKISILASEQDAGGTPAPAVLKPAHSNRFALVGGILLIGLGAISVFLAYRFVTNTPVIKTQLSIPSLIFADTRAEIEGEGKSLQTALANLKDNNLSQNSVLVAYVTYATTTAEGVQITEPATGGALIAALALPAPNIVLRNIEPDSTVGVVRTGGESYPFFVLRVSSYERTFAGMLTWERSLTKDLSLLYPTYPTNTKTHATSTSATTTPTTIPLIPPFTDAIVANRDVRIAKDQFGRTLLVYGYRDKKTLLIARSEAAFEVLVERLANSKR